MTDVLIDRGKFGYRDAQGEHDVIRLEWCSWKSRTGSNPPKLGKGPGTDSHPELAERTSPDDILISDF